MIKVKLTKKENASYYHKQIGDVVEIPFEEYLCGVVAAEIGALHDHACKAQAVASRTYAWPYYISGKPISDSSSSAQSFSAPRAHDVKYILAHKAVSSTAGLVLTYNGSIISPCSFSSSNGGRTTSSKERWGGERAYLIEQDDPWDLAATGGIKKGHGVGMSQSGALYAASRGVSFVDILAFYYPGTTMKKEAMPMAIVKASDLIADFKQMAKEKWKYVAGGARKGEVDCSGAFTYAYNKHDGFMYHGSNTMWHKYATDKGEIGKVNLVPGMAVYKKRKWTSSQSGNTWYDDDPGDVYHVGLYIGNKEVVEAKGTKYGVVTSDLDEWHLASKLKGTEYDVKEEDDNVIDVQENIAYPCMGEVDISSGYLNIRSKPSTTSRRIAKALKGDTMIVTGRTGDWYSVEYLGKQAYATAEFIKLFSEAPKVYCFSLDVVGKENMNKVKQALSSVGFTPTITEEDYESVY